MSGEEHKAYQAERMNLVMTLAIAYHNTGTECEFLKKYAEGIENY